jgi:gamma-tubulin complex component 2
MFANWTASLSRHLCSADASLAGTAPAITYLSTVFPSARHPVPERLKTFDPEALARMADMLDTYEKNFNRHLRLLLDALDYYAATETVALSRLCAQLSVASEKGAAERGSV